MEEDCQPKYLYASAAKEVNLKFNEMTKFALEEISDNNLTKSITYNEKRNVILTRFNNIVHVGTANYTSESNTKYRNCSGSMDTFNVLNKTAGVKIAYYTVKTDKVSEGAFVEVRSAGFKMTALPLMVVLLLSQLCWNR